MNSLIDPSFSHIFDSIVSGIAANFSIVWLTIPFSVITGVTAVFRFLADRKEFAFTCRRLYLNGFSAETRRKYTELLDTFDAEQIVAMRIKLWNSARQPIKREDFDGGQPILINCAPATVRFAGVASCRPAYLQPTVEARPSAVAIQPLLLNRKDEIKLDVLITDFKPPLGVVVEGRLLGIREPREDPGSGLRTLALYTATTSIGVIVSLLIQALLSNVLPVLTDFLARIQFTASLSVIATVLGFITAAVTIFGSLERAVRLLWARVWNWIRRRPGNVD
jgi:hypothetical protein